MKKNAIILLCIMAMVATIARAQSASRWGVTVGGNYNEIHFKQTDIFQSDKAFGGSVGVTGELRFAGVGFGVDGSLLYTLRQGRLHLGDRRVWSSQGVGNEMCRLHYIDVPLNLKFCYRNLNGVENTIAPIIFAGPTFCILAGHNSVGDHLKYTRLSVLLHAGVGVELFKHLQITACYNFSVDDNMRTRLLDEHTAKLRCWQLSATYFFK